MLLEVNAAFCFHVGGAAISWCKVFLPLCLSKMPFYVKNPVNLLCERVFPVFCQSWHGCGLIGAVHIISKITVSNYRGKMYLMSGVLSFL